MSTFYHATAFTLPLHLKGRPTIWQLPSCSHWGSSCEKQNHYQCRQHWWPYKIVNALLLGSSQASMTHWLFFPCLDLDIARKSMEGKFLISVTKAYRTYTGKASQLPCPEGNMHKLLMPHRWRQQLQSIVRGSSQSLPFQLLQLYWNAFRLYSCS